MAIKPNGQDCVIKEQILEEDMTGLTFQFERYDEDANAGCKMTIYGNFKHGNREVIFSKDGVWIGGGTHRQGICRPTWLKEIS